MPYTGTAVAWPLYKAIATAIEADVAITAMLRAAPSVFNLRAPAGTDGDYIVLGGISESEFPIFIRGGSEGVLTIHLWTKGIDGANAAKLYGELHRVLNQATIPIEGHGSMTGALALVDIQGDADGKYAHGVVRYSVTAIRAA